MRRSRRGLPVSGGGGEGAGVLPGHERVGEGVAFGDALVRDVETKVAGGGGLELLAGGQKWVSVPNRSKKSA